MYTTRRCEDRDGIEIIADTFFNYISYFALIDIGSTHSYVACTIFVNLGIPVESTSREVFMISPLGQSVRVNKIYRSVVLKIQGVVFPANLIELLFEEFDLIFGMDWLVEHRVSLDCASKQVILISEDDIRSS